MSKTKKRAMIESDSDDSGSSDVDQVCTRGQWMGGGGGDSTNHHTLRLLRGRCDDIAHQSGPCETKTCARSAWS